LLPKTPKPQIAEENIFKVNIFQQKANFIE